MYNNSVTNLQRGTFSSKIILIKCLRFITCHSTMLHRHLLSKISITKHLRYQMLLAFYTKWPKSKHLNVSILFCVEWSCLEIGTIIGSKYVQKT